MALVSVSALTLLFNNLAIITIILLLTLIYLSTRNHDFFKKRGVPYIKPLPIFGNMFRYVLQITGVAELYLEYYNKYPNAPVVGIFEFIKPTFLIRDTEMVKQICIKEFDSFVNHRQTVDHNVDPIFGRNLFIIKDQRWKDMRTILSPAFTGAKMRFLYDLIRDCAFNACNFIEKEAGGKSYEFEAKDLFTRLSNDVIATSAFGIEVNSLKEKENIFYKHGRQLTNFNAILSLKFFLLLIFPKVMAFLRLKVLDEKSSNYFRDIVLETMKHRENSGMVRPDIIQLLLQTKSKLAANQGKEQTQWEDHDFVAQSVLFFLAGFETTASMFSFMAYELALNEDVQDKLMAEIDECNSNLNGNQPTYEDINKLKYLDMCIQEALRKWPSVIFNDRECNKTTTLRGSNGFELTLYPGDSIELPTYAMQRDPRFFPNPDKFDPERFSDENKDSLDQFSFLSFGIGPRQCIGNRFALMECKLLYFSILSKFRIVKNARTETPIQLKKGVFNNIAKNGIWLNLKPKN